MRNEEFFMLTSQYQFLILYPFPVWLLGASTGWLSGEPGWRRKMLRPTMLRMLTMRRSKLSSFFKEGTHSRRLSWGGARR